jgi:hypothetical protein
VIVIENTDFRDARGLSKPLLALSQFLFGVLAIRRIPDDDHGERLAFQLEGPTADLDAQAPAIAAHEDFFGGRADGRQPFLLRRGLLLLCRANRLLEQGGYMDVEQLRRRIPEKLGREGIGGHDLLLATDDQRSVRKNFEKLSERAQ